MESADIMEMVSRSRGKFRSTAGYCRVSSSSSVLQQSMSIDTGILKLDMEAVVGKDGPRGGPPGDEAALDALSFSLSSLLACLSDDVGLEV